MHQHARGLFPTASPPPPLLPPYHASPTAGGNNSLLHEGGAATEFHHRTGHVVAQQQQQQQVGGGGGGHLSAVGDREQRYRYHLYERESAWAEVEKLSGYISRCAVAELTSSVDITKEKYYDLFNIGVHLLKAIEALDPDRAVKSESQYDSPPQQRTQADVGRTSPTYGMQRQGMSQSSTTTTTTSTTMASPGTTANGPSFPMGQVGRSTSAQQTYSSPSDSSFPNNPATRGYVPEAGPGKGLPPPIGGIARYNQSIVSGMLSMGQPTGQPPPMPYKQLSSDVGASPAENSSGTLWEPPGNSSTTTTTTSGRKKRQRKVKRRDLHCHVCGVTDTPEWRRGPDGDHTLCNACGLHYAKALKKEREAREKEGRKHSIDMLLNQGTTKPNEPTNTTPLVVERQ